MRVTIKSENIQWCPKLLEHLACLKGFCWNNVYNTLTILNNIYKLLYLFTKFTQQSKPQNRAIRCTTNITVKSGQKQLCFMKEVVKCFEGKKYIFSNMSGVLIILVLILNINILF